MHGRVFNFNKHFISAFFIYACSVSDANQWS
jgi:hypothetical protein